VERLQTQGMKRRGQLLAGSRRSQDAARRARPLRGGAWHRGRSPRGPAAAGQAATRVAPSRESATGPPVHRVAYQPVDAVLPQHAAGHRPGEGRELPAGTEAAPDEQSGSGEDGDAPRHGKPVSRRRGPGRPAHAGRNRHAQERVPEDPPSLRRDDQEREAGSGSPPGRRSAPRIRRS